MRTYKISVKGEGAKTSQGTTPQEAFSKVYPGIKLIPTTDINVAIVCIENIEGLHKTCNYYMVQSNTDTAMQERLKKIQETAKKARQEEKREREQQEELIKNIRLLKPRIQNLLQLAEACRKNGVDIPYEYLADGWYHRLGIMWQEQEEYKYLGRYAGGYFGPWDFYTDGEQVFNRHEETGKIVTPDIGDMKIFMEKFPEFESRFLKFIDSLQ